MAAKGIQTPVGTLDELKEAGLDPARYGSCAARVYAGNGPPQVLGCAFHSPNRKGVAKCSLPCKGKGPEMLKVRTLKRNGRRIELQMPCYLWYQNIYPENKMQGGNISRIAGIAKAGETLTYIAKETQPKKSVDNNNVIIVKHERVFVNREIKPFERPKDNPLLKDDVSEEQIRMQDEQEQQDAAWRERMGREPAAEFMGDDFMQGEAPAPKEAPANAEAGAGGS